MSEYKSIATIKEELTELVEYNDIDINDWITLDDCLYITEYFNNEVPSKQINIEWATISSSIWVGSVVINDGENFLHFTFRVYNESEPASKLLN